MHRVRMLQHFGVVPFLIFDGDYLPSKAATEEDRRKRREGSRKAGLELLNAGNASQAHLELQKAVDVTPEMARQLIDELKKSGIQYIVAPYEADAQMVYLERKGIINAILSEDSDLLVFGAKCLLTKLDQYGNCIEINQADFSACRDITLTGWSEKEFRQMAILSGCDYLNSINNMGLKTAYRMVRKHKTVEKVIRMLQFDGKYHVPKGYLEAFYQAELTFLHQRVYCPISKCLVFHTEPKNPIEDGTMPFIGGDVEPTLARGVAIGDLNPMTKLPIIVKSTPLVTPRTPWAQQRPQPRHASVSDDLKKEKGVSIETFFGKPQRRIPLAEMDPNCFTPSPSQQNTLERNRSPWLAQSAPRPYVNRSAAEAVPIVPRSARPAQHSQTARTLPLACEDDSAADSTPESGKVALGRSRFFEPTLPDPSPSFNRKTRRGKKDEINIFSDDSIEEAMLGLPDFNGFGKGTKVNIFDDKTAQETHAIMDQDLTVSEDISHATEPIVDSQSTMPNLTQSSSFASSTDEPPTPDQTASFPAIVDFKERFAFTPSPHFSSKQRTAYLSTPPSSTKPSRIPLAMKSASTPTAAVRPFKARIPTPLQSLGAKAMNSPASPATPPYTPTSLAASRPVGVKRAPFSSFKRGVPFPEVVPRSKLAVVVHPEDVPLPCDDENEKRALMDDFEEGGQGSEDLIIRDSEDEDEIIEHVECGSRPVVSKLGLGKYAFRA